MCPLEAWKNLHAVRARRTRQANSLLRQISSEVHRSGIAIVARQSQLGRQAQPLAICIEAQRRFASPVLRFLLVALLAVNRETDTDRFAHDAIANPQLLALDID